MAKLSEQDVISFLKEKVALLKQELAKAEKALNYFGDVGGASRGITNGERRGRKSLNSIADALSDTISKKVKKDKKAIATIVKPRKKLAIPEEFSSLLSRDKQIIYVLSKTANISAADIAKKVAALLGTDLDAKLERNVLQRSSALKGQGQIQAQKDGRTSIYSL